MPQEPIVFRVGSDGGGARVLRSGGGVDVVSAREWGARGGALAGVRLRAGLTGRNVCLAGFPGFYPGLFELALQAGIAEGRAQPGDSGKGRIILSWLQVS
jgi:hypothetical protein